MAAYDAPVLAGAAPARPPFVFFDLETTGLSGGAGTYAFLIGLGWFDEDGGFATRKYLLPRLADEKTLDKAYTSAQKLTTMAGNSPATHLLLAKFEKTRKNYQAAINAITPSPPGITSAQASAGGHP